MHGSQHCSFVAGTFTNDVLCNACVWMLLNSSILYSAQDRPRTTEARSSFEVRVVLLITLVVWALLFF